MEWLFCELEELRILPDDSGVYRMTLFCRRKKWLPRLKIS